ncbi:MAG TPA: hypothetical protein VM345_16220 [Acidimicrobiales bacterium]|jgi:hypothetical protein|nr:hypothetical protein [Acidimicrobiales bacterium]
MPQLTAMDEHLVHQLPEPLPNTQLHHPHWRESYFFIAHQPDRLDDVVILTMASYPQRQALDSLQMGRIGGTPVLGHQARPYAGDPHTTTVGGARVEIVRPYEEIRISADPAVCELGIDLTFRARTKPYGLRRGTMRAGHEVIWDQSHMFQSGTYQGTYTHAGQTYEVDQWWGQRDHSWGIRDHGRCPLWLWFQVQLPDGFLGVWHWEYANGARVYTDGCWAATDGSDPVPLVDFAHDLEWITEAGEPAVYGDHGESAHGLRGTATFVLEGGRRVVVEAEGRFDRPYEPFQRGGLNQMKVRTDDGREGTAIFEVTGSHHHRYFPDTTPPGPLPA